MTEPGDDDTSARPSSSGGAPGSHRLAAVPRESIVTVVLVVALVVAAVAVLAWSKVGDGDGEPSAQTAETSSAATDDTLDVPTVAPPPPEPTTAGAPAPALTLPTLKQVDRKLRARGLTRVARDDVETLSFVVTSFNTLGASHTRGAGRRPGFAGAEDRLPAQIAELDRKQVSVAGLQEFQYPQVAQLAQRTGSTWQIFPGTSMGERLADNSIIWRTEVWDLVRAETIDIPYFGGIPFPMPYVLLQHRETGRRVWFGNFHNPANIGGDQTVHRRRAAEIEADLAKELNADGTPVVITGDMNDRAEFGCPFAARSGMVSANGVRDDGGQCFAPARLDVDWIFGTTDLAFSDFLSDDTVQDRRLTDHPMVTSTVTVEGAESRDGCMSRITRSGPYWYCKA